MIAMRKWIVSTVGKHIAADNTLSSGYEGVGVDKSADLGIVITGLQVIEPGILGSIFAIPSLFALSPLVFKT